ncbi:RNA polymerase subunit RP035 [Turkeypox virus]|uniref:DNA-directed RNA polymerase 35 kDa subunit n=1 Tax=Turkeypox virus TaxID=336486 RepID=A0A0M3ZCV1_9POXV|nr:RNA polymerase subunit RP035 [Turkeypox virus]ALA62517.1 RNA polymerase subunit RP035 [Turkeypox virus]
MDDIDEVSINHMLSKLSTVKDPEFAATINLMKELLKIIESKILEINKKSKKIIRSILMELMYRREFQINIATDPSIATFIKHICKEYIKIPRLNLGIVMANTTTAINEEWLTAIESIPTYKIFYQYIYEILTMQCNFCVYIKKTQEENNTYISLADIQYYIIEKDKIIKIPYIKELEETLLHSFSEFRSGNTKTIELIAFSSGTNIDDELVDKLDFIDIELFNREYKNIKTIHSTTLESYMPFNVIAPEGNLIFFMERYPWFSIREYMADILKFLKDMIDNKLSDFKIRECSITKENSIPSDSVYDKEKKITYVNDVTTMCILNFFNCECQIGTFHVFDISDINIKLFRKEVNKTITMMYNSIN